MSDYRGILTRPVMQLTCRSTGALSSWSGKGMRYSCQVKPISYLKANAANVLLRLAEQREPLVITQNGEAKAVIQDVASDVASYEETQETLALLKILALGNQEIEAGRAKPVADVVSRLRAKARDSKQPQRLS